jgi:hypothetical protein
MRCGAFHRVEGTLCLVRHGQAALSGSKTKAPGFAGGYLLQVHLVLVEVMILVHLRAILSTHETLTKPDSNYRLLFITQSFNL